MKPYWVKVFADEEDDAEEYSVHSWSIIEATNYEQALLHTSVMAKEIENEGVRIGVIEIVDMDTEYDNYIS